MTKIEKTVMLFVIDDGKILLSRRLNTWYGNKQFAPPGGLVDDGESPEVAAVRETQEETGILIDENNLVLVDRHPSTMQNRNFDSYYFVVNEWNGKLENKEPERHSELAWYALDNLPADTMSIVRSIIKKL